MEISILKFVASSESNARPLAGKVAIVTGAGRGLGRAAARRLAADGAALVLADIDPATVQDAEDEIGRLGGAAQAVHADVADEGECQRVVDTALESFGGAGILVNVANYPVPPAQAEEIDLEHWHRSFAAGPLAMFMLARAVFPHMRAAGGGRIVNFGSELSENPRPERVVYAASKGAVRALTKALAREWGRYNIHVNTIWPSAVTPSWQNWQRYNPEQVRHHLTEELALQRPGDPYADVAPVVAFLCGPDSDWVTGQTIAANGGWTMW
jgi:NAD(P)-dependent dehydrogenase (short-subunit alcohol dehydrogenase family)